jgi:hypothetical protein
VGKCLVKNEKVGNGGGLVLDLDIIEKRQEIKELGIFVL